MCAVLDEIKTSPDKIPTLTSRTPNSAI